MSDNGSVRILDGLDQAFGHLRGLLVEDGMHAGNHNIHLHEDVIGKVKLAVSENVDLNAGEDANSADFLFCLSNVLDVLHGALVIESVGESQVLGVVRDGHVFVAMLFRGLRHLFDRVAAVGLHGVHVNVALKVGLRDQLGKV